jgi:hypothetical protein
MIAQLLDAGHSETAIEDAILAGGVVWTLAGLETAIAKAKRTSPTVSYDAPLTRYV